MRTPLTPALPTGILFCALATTVSGSSTTTRAGELSLLTLGVTALAGADLNLNRVRALNHVYLLELVIRRGSRIRLRCRFRRRLGRGAAAEAAGLLAGITAGFTAGAGAPGAGLELAGTPAASSAALVSLACFCCSDFATLRALSMASGFCATTVAAEPLTISAIARMPVVSFIVIPTSPPAFRV